jgi:hypothetical protein
MVSFENFKQAFQNYTDTELGTICTTNWTKSKFTELEYTELRDSRSYTTVRNPSLYNY